jgi:AcrR family transcriptional regulator
MQDFRFEMSPRSSLPQKKRRPNRRGAASRSLILEAAVGCLAVGGIDEVRIARVARRAGVSTASVHYHFESREALVSAAVEASFKITAETRGSPSYGGGTALEQLGRKIEESLPLNGDQTRQWELWLELWLAAVQERALRSSAANVYRRLGESMRELIEQGAANGEFTPVTAPDMVTARVLAAIDGYGLRALLEDPDMPIDRARGEVWRVLTSELGVST